MAVSHDPGYPNSGDKMGTGLATQSQLAYNAKQMWVFRIQNAGRDLQHISNAKAIQIQPI